MKNNIDEQNRKLQNHLVNNHYSFSGPADENKIEDFMKLSNRISKKNYSGSIHNVLKDSESTEQALNLLGIIDTRIFVVIPNSQILFHMTVEQYCKEYNFSL